MLALFYVFENVFFIFLKTSYHANISSSKSYSYVITLLVRLLFPARTPLAHTPYCSYAYCSYRFVHIMSIETKLWLNIVLIKYKFYTYEDHYKITTLNSQIFSFHLLLELGTNIKSTTTSPITQITIIKVIWATHPQSLFWAANNWCDGLTSSNHEPKLYPLSIAPQQKKTFYVSKIHSILLCQWIFHWRWLFFHSSGRQNLRGSRASRLVGQIWCMCNPNQ